MSLSSADRELLYHLARAEAGTYSAKGISNVVWCVLNRVKSKNWPDTVKGVVYQPSQFTYIGTPGAWINNPSDFVKTTVDKAYFDYYLRPEQVGVHNGIFFHGGGFGIDWSGTHKFLFTDEINQTYYAE